MRDEREKSLAGATPAAANRSPSVDVFARAGLPVSAPAPAPSAPVGDAVRFGNAGSSLRNGVLALLLRKPGSLAFDSVRRSDRVLKQSAAAVLPAAPVITTTTMNDGTVDEVYVSGGIAWSGAQGGTWSIASGTLPTGLGMSAGNLYGTPTEAGDFNFTLRYTDPYGQYDDQDFTVTVAANAFSIDFTALADVNPYVFDTGVWDTDLNSGGAGKILSGHYYLNHPAAYQSRSVKSSVLSLAGESQVFVEFELDSPTDAGTAEFILALLADDDASAFYGHFALGELNNGYRYKIVGSNCYVLRDVAGSYTLADTLTLDAVTAASPTVVRIVVTVNPAVGETPANVTHQLYQDGVLKDTFTETHASRHTSFLRAGFSITSFGVATRLKSFRYGPGTGA